MDEAKIYKHIRVALNEAPCKKYTVDLHLQMLKYADVLNHVTGKQFCEGVELNQSYGAEFNKMRNLTPRLKAAGLNVALL